MEKSMFFNSIIKDGRPDRVYKAEDFALYFGTFIGNGVFPKPSTGLQVLENDNMSVKVSKGYGWINGYMYYNTGNHVVKIDPADGVLNRIDRIVLRLDFSARDIHLDILKGEPATKATAKELTRNEDIYELGLADVAVNKGIIKIIQANITDTRLNKELCGIVHGTIDQVDTTSIFNQFQSWFDTSTEQWRTEFEEWFETVKDILNEDVASKLAKQIADLNLKVNIIDTRIGKNDDLKTNSKNTIISAINEVFTDVDNGKRGLYGAIVDKGTTPSSQDFKDLESAIRDIKTGGGTAQPSDVLQGKTFTNDSGLETGTMVNRGSLILPPSKITVSHPSGYYSQINYTGITGKQIETLYTDFKPENIKKGIDIGGTVGTLEVGHPVLVFNKESFTTDDYRWEFYNEADYNDDGLLFLISAYVTAKYDGNRECRCLFAYDDVFQPSFQKFVTFSSDKNIMEISPAYRVSTQDHSLDLINNGAYDLTDIIAYVTFFKI